MTARAVYVVAQGERGEGMQVESVHASFKGARASAEDIAKALKLTRCATHEGETIAWGHFDRVAVSRWKVRP